MKKFKQELQLMGAKEGRVRTVGGYNAWQYYCLEVQFLA
jgi:hypothetical protein